MPMWTVVSCVFGRRCLLWPACSLGKTLLAFALINFILQSQTCLLFQLYFWLPTSVFQSPMMKRTSFFAVSSRRSCTQTWITIMLNGLHEKQTKIILPFLRLHPSTAFQTLEYEDQSIPSKGLFPTVVDIMVIWIKLSNSYPFWFTDS